MLRPRKIPLHPGLRLLAALILLAPAQNALCETPPPPGHQPFHAGLIALQQNDPLAAASQFEQALKETGPSPEIFFNLGLAYQAAGQPTPAALAFARAFFLNPGNPQTARIAQELTRFSGAAAGWDAPLLNALRKAGLNTLYWAAAALVWAGIFLLASSLTRPHPRASVLASATIALLLGLGLFITTLRADPLASMRNWAVVFPKEPSPTIPLRAAPIETAASPERLDAGAFVKIHVERAGWVYCETLRGRSGWLPSAQVIPVIPADTAGQN